MLIASPANPRLKLLRALASSRGVRRHRRALVCGRRIVEELMRRHPGRVETLVYPEGDPGLEIGPADGESGGLDGLVKRDGASAPARGLGAVSTPGVVVLPRAMFREVDPFGVDPPIAVAIVDPLAEWAAATERGGLTLFLPLGDPENVGAALRSAAAFGVDRVVLLEEAAHPFHPRAIRASAGACFDLALRSGPALAELLAAPPAGLDLLVLDREGEPLDGVAPAADVGLVVGEEGRGVAGMGGGVRRVTIPIAPAVDSLNGAVAVGIALWHLRGGNVRTGLSRSRGAARLLPSEGEP